jgi:hypothetical protein
MTTNHTNPTDLTLLNTVADHVKHDRFVSALRQLAALRAVLEPWENAARKVREDAYAAGWVDRTADANDPTGEDLRADTVAAERLITEREIADEIHSAVRAFATAARRIEDAVGDLATAWERSPADYLAEHRAYIAANAAAAAAAARPKRGSRSKA